MTLTASSHPIKRIATQAWPIFIGQLAVIANGVIDTAMTSRYSATDLAALSIATSIYICVFVGTSGVLYALSPIVGQLFGAGRFQEIGNELKQGVWLAIFLCIVGCLILLFPQPLLSLAHASPELNTKATLYLQVLALALPATLGFRIYGAFNNAIARPKAVMLIQLAALLLKIPFNALLIFGGFGIPEFGGPGCAIATTLTAWMSLIAAWIMLHKAPGYHQFSIFGSGFIMPNWAAQRTLLKLGIPMGLSYLIEVSAFAFMALFIARFGDTIVAGHQITANFVAVLYMLPLSIASATGTLVAHSIGAHEMHVARKIGNTGIATAGLLAAGIGLIVWFSREMIVRAYTPNPDIIAAALPLFAFIGIYHLCDALQVTSAFVLRAYKVAVVPTIIYALMLWGVGLGGGYILGFALVPFHWLPHGAAGFWLGNTASVFLAAVCLGFYLRSVQHKVGYKG